MAFDLQFLGAAGTVTGSRYLLKYNDQKILVDCGMFQGIKALRLKNWEKFSVNPAEINSIILTHAHLDHSGYIPRIIKEGFKGKIYCTPATKDLCAILLPDAGHLMEEEAEFLNRHKATKHSPALPLFTVKDAQDALLYFETVPYQEKKSLGSDINFEFHYVGHILGAASAIVEVAHKKIHEIWKNHSNYYMIESTNNFIGKVHEAAKKIQLFVPDCCKEHLEGI